MSSEASPKKQLILKRGPNGKYILPLNQLRNVAIGLPPTFPGGEYSAVFMQDGAGNTTIGITKDQVDVTPIEDAARLYEVSRIAKKLENDAARAAKRITAQKILFDTIAEEKKEDPVPSPHFEKAAVDMLTAGQLLDENVEFIQRTSPEKKEEKLAKAFLIEQANEMVKATKQWVFNLAHGVPNTPVTFEQAVKAAGISHWVYTKLLTKIPIGTNSWFNFLFPKDGNKHIRMKYSEYEKAISKPNGYKLLAPSRAIFDLVERFGESEGKKDDRSSSYTLLQPFAGLEQIPKVRVKVSTVKTVSKKLGPLLETIYKLNRAIVPLVREERSTILGMLFKDPSFDENSVENPIQQIVGKKEQEFKLFKLKPQDIKEAMQSYGVPRHQLISDDELKGIGDVLPIREIVNWNSVEVGYTKSSIPPKRNENLLAHFQERLKSKGILQPPERVYKDPPMATFVPKGNTLELLTLVRGHKYFKVVLRDVEIYLNSFKNEALRQTAAGALFAALVGIHQPKVQIEKSDTPPDEEEYVEDAEGHQDDEY